MVDARGNGFSSEGKIVGLDADRDLAVLKVLSRSLSFFLHLMEMKLSAIVETNETCNLHLLLA